MSSKPILPPRLKEGARVALIAPAGPLLERDDQVRGAELCRALGYEPVLGPNAGGAYGYLAGTDDERLADLNGALTDPRIDAVWCLRGGNGMNRILDRVDFAGFARRPKPVIGYSDITVLLLGLLSQTNVASFHGPMARSPMPNFSRWHFDRILTNVSAAGTLGRLAPAPDVLVPTDGRIITIRGGVARGPLVGGNLTLLQVLAGTRYFPDLRGAILFLEDVSEDLYSIDRMLAHLRMLGAFRGLAGVAVGRFTEMKRATDDGGLGLDVVLDTYFGPLNIPVASGFPIGHISEQWTVPVGVMAELDATAHEVTILEPAVQ